MIVNHDVPSLVTYNAITANNSALQKSIKRLATGLCINSAADDAAGLAISEKMCAQIMGLDKAVSNAQDGISMIRTAEGALGEIHSILQRMRELSVQAANDTLTQEDRAYVRLEIDQLLEEIDRIAATTQFNRKKLLDGSASALWSSDNLSTEAVIRGGLTSKDAFGQTVSAEGNYFIEITAEPGAAQVQKSQIFEVSLTKRVEETYNETAYGGTAYAVFVLDDTGSISGERTRLKENIIAFVDSIKAQGVEHVNIGIASYAYDDTPDSSHSELTGLSPITFADGGLWSSDIGEIEAGLDSILFDKGHGENVSRAIIDAVGTYFAGSATENYFSGIQYYQSRYVVAVTDSGDNTEDSSGNYICSGAADFAEEAQIALQEGDPARKVVLSAIRTSSIGPNAGVLDPMIESTGGMKFEYGTDWGEALCNGLGVQIGKNAVSDYLKTTFETTYNDLGFSDHQSLTITQGDGKSVSVTLYAGDTILDAARKINAAIADGLGQKQYLTTGSDNFCTLADGTPGTSESVMKQEFIYDEDGNITGYKIYSTLLVRSAVAGKAGELHFSGSEELLKALGLNTIRESSENRFTVTVYDAHTGKLTASSAEITGNMLAGVINPNVDVIFDPMANVQVVWNEASKSFTLSKEAGVYRTTLHLADNSTVLQIGANEGENMILDFGDMSVAALGLTGLLVTDRESAARSVTIVDNAIGKVSTQRAKLGAYQNRLEHTTTNLTTAMTNLTAAESRIRDTDMGKEMMEFTKLNILTQAGMAMAAQANQLPQNVLALLRG